MNRLNCVLNIKTNSDKMFDEPQLIEKMLSGVGYYDLQKMFIL